MKIGFFDSGLGGLTVLDAVRKTLPGASLYYLGDTARTPYGSKSPETVLRYSRECADFLSQWNLDLLIVACNTASSHAVSALRAELNFPVLGTISAAVEQVVASTKNELIGVIGTESTIASGVYNRALKDALPESVLHQCACPLFVPLVEQGMFSGEIVDKVIEHYLAPLRKAKIDSLLLGCTHYPLLRESLNNFFEGEVALIECSQSLASHVSQFAEESSFELIGDEHYFVTDEESRFKALASLFLGGKEVEVVRVQELHDSPSSRKLRIISA